MEEILLSFLYPQVERKNFEKPLEIRLDICYIMPRHKRRCINCRQEQDDLL